MAMNVFCWLILLLNGKLIVQTRSVCKYLQNKSLAANSGILINSLPNGKILDWSKLNAFADDKMKVTEKLLFVYRNAENIVGKGENIGYQYFSFSHYLFENLLQGRWKSWLCGEELTR